MPVPKRQAEQDNTAEVFDMKKQAIVISVLIAVVLVAMFLPWAFLWENSHEPGYPVTYTTGYGYYAFGWPVGYLYAGLSFVLALLAFVLSFFNRKCLLCRIFCGLLLLDSAGMCFYQGIRSGFDNFTALTWGIFGALILLGIWTLFFIKTERKTTAK